MKKLLSVLLLLCLLLAGCSAPATTPEAPVYSDELIVHFIDVGQADSVLLEYNEQYALIDAGKPESGRIVVDYLLKLGVEKLNLVVATHMHGDHMGGLPDVVSAFPVERIWCSPRTYYSNAFDDLNFYADQQDVVVEKPMLNETVVLGDVHMKLIGPISKSYIDLNNTSLVIMATHEENKFLFTGDMRWEAEQELVEAGVDLKADVLKVGHHGSYTSTSYLFLNEVMPDYAVIMCGRNNEYGHPHDAPMSRLRDAGVTIYRTDRMGTILATSDGENISFSWEFTNVNPEVNS